MTEKERLELLHYYVSAARDALASYEDSMNTEKRALSLVELKGLLNQLYRKIQVWREHA